MRRMPFMSDQNADNPGVIGFPPLIWAVGAAISALVHFFVARVPIMSNYRICLVCGVALVILAPTLAISAAVTFKKAGTNVDPAERR